MLDLESMLTPKEFKEFETAIIEWGADYDLHKSYDELNEFIEQINGAEFEEGKTLNDLTLDAAVIKFWVEKLKSKIAKHAKAMEKGRNDMQREKERKEELKRQFVKRRAAGESVKSISESLNISYEDLTSWLAKGSDFYALLSYESKLELEDVQSKYLSSKKKRLEFIGDALDRITKAIKERNFEDVPTDKLLEYAIKYMNLLNSETITVDLKVETDFTPKFTSTKSYNI